MLEKFDRNKEFILNLIIGFLFFVKIFIGWLLSYSFFERGNSYTNLNAIAGNIINYGEFSIVQGVYSIDYEPLYPILLAFSYTIFGENWSGVTIIQAGLYALSSWLIYKIGSIIWDSRAGVFAAILHSFYPFLFFHSLSIIDTTLFIFLTLALVHSVLLVRPKVCSARLLDYFFIGFFLALLFLCRGTAIVFVPGLILILVLWLWRDKNFFRISGCCLSLIVFAVIVSPWLVRNYQLTDELFISAHGSFGLWQGNNENSLELLKNNISLDRVYQKNPPQLYQRFPLAPRDPGQALLVESLYKAKAVEFILANPYQFIELSAWKFIKLWSPFYNPIGRSYSYGSVMLRQIFNVISYTPILILSIIGAMQLLIKKDKRDYLIFFLSLILFFTIAHMIVMGYTRLRLPIDPILMVLAGVAMSKIFDQNKER